MATQMAEEMVGYPEALAPYAGRINDLDSHAEVPNELWESEFGSIAKPFSGTRAPSEAKKFYELGYGTKTGVRFENDETLTRDNVWFTKGTQAYGSYEIDKRVDVLNFTGVDKQLIFPGGFGITACVLYGFADVPGFLPMITGDRRKYAVDMMRAYNDWVLRVQNEHSRLRPIAVLYGDTQDEINDEAKRLIDAGVRAIWVPDGKLLGGKSPAHTDNDRFWSLLEDSNTTAAFHPGTRGSFFGTLEWKNAEAFTGWKVSAEFDLDPWSLGTMSLPTQNYVITMVAGGVLERHPRLRIAIAEASAGWLSPLAQNLDMWSQNQQPKIWAQRFSMKPSEYIRRNIRISGFPWEPMDQYMEYYGLEECYCYASDYPHIEGGTDPMGNWDARLDRLGPDAKEKFFVKNAEWVLPD